jgi:hypothetical protein
MGYVYGAVLFLIIFTTVAGILLNIMGYAHFSIWTPVIFGAIQGLMMVVITFSGGNISILGNSFPAKGFAMAAWVTSIIIYIFILRMPSQVSLWVTAILIIPSIIAMGMEFLEVGKQ